MATFIVRRLLWLPVLWGAFLALAGLGGALHSGVSAFGAAPGLRVGVALLAGFGLTLCWFQTEARYTIPARHMLLAFASIPVASLVTRALDRLGGQASQSDSGCRSVNPSLVSSLCLAKMFPQIKRRLRRDWGRRPP